MFFEVENTVECVLGGGRSRFGRTAWQPWPNVSPQHAFRHSGTMHFLPDYRSFSVYKNCKNAHQYMDLTEIYSKSVSFYYYCILFLILTAFKSIHKTKYSLSLFFFWNAINI